MFLKRALLTSSSQSLVRILRNQQQQHLLAFKPCRQNEARQFSSASNSHGQRVAIPNRFAAQLVAHRQGMFPWSSVRFYPAKKMSMAQAKALMAEASKRANAAQPSAEASSSPSSSESPPPPPPPEPPVDSKPTLSRSVTGPEQLQADQQAQTRPSRLVVIMISVLAGTLIVMSFLTDLESEDAPTMLSIALNQLVFAAVGWALLMAFPSVRKAAFFSPRVGAISIMLGSGCFFVQTACRAVSPDFDRIRDQYMHLVGLSGETQLHEGLALGTTSAICDEFIFRGLVLPAIGNSPTGVLGSTILFALPHARTTEHLLYGVYMLFVGAVFGTAMMQTGNLVIPVASATILNLLTIADYVEKEAMVVATARRKAKQAEEEAQRIKDEQERARREEQEKRLWNRCCRLVGGVLGYFTRGSQGGAAATTVAPVASGPTKVDVSAPPAAPSLTPGLRLA